MPLPGECRELSLLLYFLALFHFISHQPFDVEHLEMFSVVCSVDLLVLILEQFPNEGDVGESLFFIPLHSLLIHNRQYLLNLS